MNAQGEAARRAALAAGAFVRERFNARRTGRIVEKGQNDFVTEVDTTSEAMIKEALAAAFPATGFLAEESAETQDAGEFWIIDPLDGTTNFIHGYPAIGVSIALLEGGRLTVGCVYDPLRDELFEAEAGGGAFLNGKRIVVSGAKSLETSLLGTGFPFSVPEHLEAYLAVFRDLFRGCRDIRRAGAAVLDLSHVACGRLDGFWELYLKPWDMAAGALIVREAGGTVSDFFGSPDFLETGNIVAASPGIFDRIVAATGRHFTPDSVAGLSTHFIG
ncbi:MAG: inositol monophosphatase family protein [Candidatus Krumholzibacteriaceae bacterium]|jgi:myo-inositol-1(or 4)-monophosphatase